MLFTWPDPISLVADVVTIVGIPVLAVTTYRLYREYAKGREVKNVSQDCLESNENKTGINLVPLKKVAALPRPRDIVFLPGEPHEGKNYGSGEYEVERVAFAFNVAQEAVKSNSLRMILVTSDLTIFSLEQE